MTLQFPLSSVQRTTDFFFWIPCEEQGNNCTLIIILCKQKIVAVKKAGSLQHMNIEHAKSLYKFRGHEKCNCIA